MIAPGNDNDHEMVAQWLAALWRRIFSTWAFAMTDLALPQKPKPVSKIDMQFRPMNCAAN